jgi:hypothetical protein
MADMLWLILDIFPSLGDGVRANPWRFGSACRPDPNAATKSKGNARNPKAANSPNIDKGAGRTGGRGGSFFRGEAGFARS